MADTRWHNTEEMLRRGRGGEPFYQTIATALCPSEENKTDDREPKIGKFEDGNREES